MGKILKIAGMTILSLVLTIAFVGTLVDFYNWVGGGNKYFSEYTAKYPPHDSVQASFSLLSDVPIACQRVESTSLGERFRRIGRIKKLQTQAALATPSLSTFFSVSSAFAAEQPATKIAGKAYFEENQCSCPRWADILYYSKEELGIVDWLKKIRHEERLKFCLEELYEFSKINGCT